VIFDIVEYLIMEWTMPTESRTWRICRICRRVLILKKKKKSVAGAASLPQSSIGQKRIAGLKNQTGKITGRQVLVNFFFKPAESTRSLRPHLAVEEKHSLKCHMSFLHFTAHLVCERLQSPQTLALCLSLVTPTPSSVLLP